MTTAIEDTIGRLSIREENDCNGGRDGNFSSRQWFREEEKKRAVVHHLDKYGLLAVDVFRGQY